MTRLCCLMALAIIAALASCYAGDERGDVTPTTAEDAALEAAALTGDPDHMAETLTALAAACNGTTSCGAGFTACTAWSSVSLCGEPYCGPSCGPPCQPDEPCHRPRQLRQNRERYRVCFDKTGSSCTEFAAVTPQNQGCGADPCGVLEPEEP